MGKLVHLVHQSLDGYMEGPDGAFDWPAMGPELSAHSQALTPEGTVFLYGRKVWEMMAGFWPNAERYSDDPHDLAFAPVWRKAAKVVVSRTLGEAGHGARVISADPAAELAALKAAGHDLVLFGGSVLAERGLVDEHQVVTHPVLLRGGRRTFPVAPGRTPLTLLEARTFDGRTVLTRHAPA
ncbi:dihydrofolate reductase family protein [Kitasatospora sp. NPDC051853]|uniref:dihydrofolate reductase family protein n=1 Tax=Kitasatospora sp. NPDC051853 TaxID=3364058 RepID=UPI00379C8E14